MHHLAVDLPAKHRGDLLPLRLQGDVIIPHVLDATELTWRKRMRCDVLSDPFEQNVR